MTDPVAPTDTPEVPDPDPTDEPFDAERAKAKIAKANSEASNLRKRLKELEPLAARAQELEEAGKSEAQKLTERLVALEKERDEAATSALRFQIATEKGVPAPLVRFLPSGTREEMEAAADTLLAELGAQGQPRRPAPTPTQGTTNGNVAGVTPGDEFAAFLSQQLKT